jgi:uncharacterized protein YkwD
MARGLVVAGLLAMVALPVAPAAAREGDAPGALASELNEVRAHRGLAPLESAPKLLASAGRYARTLARAGRFSHTGIAPRNGFRHVGEALAMHRGSRPAPHRTLRSLLRSAPHRALLLSPHFKQVGLGHAAGRVGGVSSTIWVVHLGAR